MDVTATPVRRSSTGRPTPVRKRSDASSSLIAPLLNGLRESQTEAARELTKDPFAALEHGYASHAPFSESPLVTSCAPPPGHGTAKLTRPIAEVPELPESVRLPAAALSANDANDMSRGPAMSSTALDAVSPREGDETTRTEGRRPTLGPASFKQLRAHKTQNFLERQKDEYKQAPAKFDGFETGDVAISRGARALLSLDECIATVAVMISRHARTRQAYVHGMATCQAFNFSEYEDEIAGAGGLLCALARNAQRAAARVCSADESAAPVSGCVAHRWLPGCFHGLSRHANSHALHRSWDSGAENTQSNSDARREIRQKRKSLPNSFVIKNLLQHFVDELFIDRTVIIAVAILIERLVSTPGLLPDALPDERAKRDADGAPPRQASTYSAFDDPAVVELPLAVTWDNWQPILVGAIIIASKTLEDVGVWNVDVQKASERAQLHFTLDGLRLLEARMLQRLNWRANVQSSTYGTYYLAMCRLIAPRDEDAELQLTPRAHSHVEERDEADSDDEQNVFKGFTVLHQTANTTREVHNGRLVAKRIRAPLSTIEEQSLTGSHLSDHSRPLFKIGTFGFGEHRASSPEPDAARASPALKQARSNASSPGLTERQLREHTERTRGRASLEDFVRASLNSSKLGPTLTGADAEHNPPQPSFVALASELPPAPRPRQKPLACTQRRGLGDIFGLPAAAGPPARDTAERRDGTTVRAAPYSGRAPLASVPENGQMANADFRNRPPEDDAQSRATARTRDSRRIRQLGAGRLDRSNPYIGTFQHARHVVLPDYSVLPEQACLCRNQQICSVCHERAQNARYRESHNASVSLSTVTGMQIRRELLNSRRPRKETT